jgi:hypothetical protein
MHDEAFSRTNVRDIERKNEAGVDYSITFSSEHKQIWEKPLHLRWLKKM